MQRLQQARTQGRWRGWAGARLQRLQAQKQVQGLGLPLLCPARALDWVQRLGKQRRLPLAMLRLGRAPARWTCLQAQGQGQS